MKHLTTFLLGLIFVFFGIFELIIFKENFGFNWNIINGILGIISMWIGVEKLEKSTN